MNFDFKERLKVFDANRHNVEQQEHFRAMAAQLYAEADATEQQPGIYTDPQKASIANAIAEKHRKMGLRV